MDKTPFYKNAFGFSALALLTAGGIFLADIILVMTGVEGGLPEAMSTPAWSLVASLGTYAGTCLEKR